MATQQKDAILTEEEYRRAAERIWELFDAEPGTPEGEEFEDLAAQVEAYEEIHYPIEPPSPAGCIRVRLEDFELSEEALVPVIGSRAAVTAVLAGERELTPLMAADLSEWLMIPVDLLLPGRGGKASVLAGE